VNDRNAVTTFMNNDSKLSRRTFLGDVTISTLMATAGIGGFARPLTAGSAHPVADAWQIGSYTRPWDQWDYRVALDGIAEAGYRYVGLMTHKGKSWILINVDTPAEEVDAIAQEVKQRGLKTVSIYGGDFPVKESVTAGITGLKTLIDHCRICSCPNLLLGGTNDPELAKPYYEVVAACCDDAARKGIGMSIKPHGGTNATGAVCRKLVEQVGKPNFGIWYDPGNIFYYSDGKRDPVGDCADVDGLVVGMSVKDFLPPKEVMVTPGRGKVDFAAVMKRLRDGGFRGGPLVVECVKTGSLSETTARAKAARLFIEELVAASP